MCVFVTEVSLAVVLAYVDSSKESSLDMTSITDCTHIKCWSFW